MASAGASAGVRMASGWSISLSIKDSLSINKLIGVAITLSNMRAHERRSGEGPGAVLPLTDAGFSDEGNKKFFLCGHGLRV